MSLINTQVQPFKVQAFKNGKFIEVTEESLKGKWSAFIFMPAAFTFNCPTEVEDAADNYAEFQKLEAEVYIVTTDSHFAHKVWHETSPAVGCSARRRRSRLVTHQPIAATVSSTTEMLMGSRYFSTLFHCVPSPYPAAASATVHGTEPRIV